MIDWKSEIRKRLSGLKLEPAREVEIIDELAQHLEDRYGELRACGIDDLAAHQTVLAELSNTEVLKQEMRRVERSVIQEPTILGASRRSHMFVDLLQDLGYASRLLRKHPGFTSVAVLTLTLGIGLNVAVFSVVNAVLLKPLPYREPNRLVLLQNQFMARNLRNAGVSAADYSDYRNQKHIFEDVAAGFGTGFNLTGVDRPENVTGSMVTAGFFDLLGINPVAGRTFTEQEDRPGFNQVVVLAEGFWKRRFGGDPGVIGSTVQLNDQSYTIIGVVPPASEVLGSGDVFAPAAFSPEQLNRTARGSRSLFAIGRLARGISFEQAQTDIHALAQSLATEFPADYPSDSGWGIRIDSLSELLVGDVRLALWVLMGAVGFVLFIACTNVANLLLSRATTRAREISIRIALGANSGRIARQLLTENLLLGLIGGGLGLLLAVWGIELLIRIGPKNFPRLNEIKLDWPVMIFTLGVSLLTGLLSGLAPLVEATRRNLHEGLKDGARRSGGERQKRVRNVLVVLEVALSLVLLVGAGLLLQSFLRIQNVDPGFQSQNALTFRVPLSSKRYPEQSQRVAFINQLEERIRTVPGVTAVGATSMLPFIGVNSSGIFSIDSSEARPGSLAHADIRRVTPGFFDAIGIPIQKGRFFNEGDNASTPFVALIDEKLAAQYWPGEDPIGKGVRPGGPRGPLYTIVGVVGHVKHSQLDAESKGALYFLYSQNRAFMITFVVRSNSHHQLAAIVQREAWAIDQDVPVFEIKTMSERLLDTLTPRRAAAYLVTVFAGLALLLAITGVYGVMSNSVSQRTNEIGIRLALGAQVRDVMTMVIRQGVVLALVGVSIGLAGSFALTRLMASLLFEVSTTDLPTFAGVSGLLIAVAIFACWFPARRASRVDPMTALKCE